MKIKAKDLGEKERIKTLDALYTASGSLKGRDAVKRFLRDLLTESERIMLGRRILIAQKLLRGAGYREIARSLGVGRDTVEKVRHWLEDQMPGFEEAIKGMEKEYRQRKTRAEIAHGPFSFAALKRKYPLHFLLSNIVDELSKHSKN